MELLEPNPHCHSITISSLNISLPCWPLFGGSSFLRTNEKKKPLRVRYMPGGLAKVADDVIDVQDCWMGDALQQ